MPEPNEEVLEEEDNQEETVEETEPLTESSEEEEPEKEETTPSVKYYTPEEMRSLPFDEVDTSKIPPEMQPFYQAMQSGVTKKFQDIAAQRKQLDREIKAQPQDIYEAYRQDPDGVSNKIETQINKLFSEVRDLNASGDFEEASKKQEEIYSLQNLTRKLERQSLKEREQENKLQILHTQAQQEITKVIPDFESKSPKLTEYAKSKGFTDNEIDYLTNPAIVGKDIAVKVVKFINEQYSMQNIDKTLKNKEKTTLLKTERSGSGGEDSNSSSSTLLAKAKESGDEEDFVAYLRSKRKKR